MPIVIMSPAIELREGPDFAFGARWALMQYHPWQDRQEFLRLDDTATKDYFREWAEGKTEGEKPPCPWYVRDQYEQENSRSLRVARGSGPARGQAQPSSGGEAPGEGSRDAGGSTERSGPARRSGARSGATMRSKRAAAGSRPQSRTRTLAF